jgi:hypothetical protein
MRFAQDFASRDHDVLIEGLRLSSDVALSAKLASANRLHILLLSTPLQECARNLCARRRTAKSYLPAFERSTTEEHRRVQDACARLQGRATVEVMDFDGALARARELLGLGELRAAA